MFNMKTSDNTNSLEVHPETCPGQRFNQCTRRDEIHLIMSTHDSKPVQSINLRAEPLVRGAWAGSGTSLQESHKTQHELKCQILHIVQGRPKATSDEDTGCIPCNPASMRRALMVR